MEYFVYVRILTVNIFWETYGTLYVRHCVAEHIFAHLTIGDNNKHKHQLVDTCAIFFIEVDILLLLRNIFRFVYLLHFSLFCFYFSACFCPNGKPCCVWVTDPLSISTYTTDFGDERDYLLALLRAECTLIACIFVCFA